MRSKYGEGRKSNIDQYTKHPYIVCGCPWFCCCCVFYFRNINCKAVPYFTVTLPLSDSPSPNRAKCYYPANHSTAGPPVSGRRPKPQKPHLISSSASSSSFVTSLHPPFSLPPSSCSPSTSHPLFRPYWLTVPLSGSEQSSLLVIIPYLPLYIFLWFPL